MMIDKHQMTTHKWRNFICILRQMLAYAVEEEYISVNPFDKVKVDKGLRLYPEEIKASEEEVFNDDEMRRIIEYCRDYYSSGKALKQRYAPLAIIFASYTGARLGEVAALKFEDIEYGEVDHCRIRRQVNPSLKATVPYAKHHKYRRIILPTKASEIVAEIKRDRSERGLPVDSYIFSPDENVIATYLRIRSFIYDVCDAIEIPRRSMHKIRKTTISTMYGKVNINTLRNQMGHADKQTTINNYVFDTSVDKSKLAAMDAAFDF